MISVVVVNYNSGSFLNGCVQSVLGQADEVIIVDNASTDSSLDQLIACFENEPRLKIIRNKVNRGFAAGCNIGLNAAKEPYILFLNPDCVLGADSLQLLIQMLKADSSTGMVGGMLINPDGTEQAGGRRSVPTPWRSFVRVFGLVRFRDRYPRLFSDFLLNGQLLPSVPIEVEAISGSFMLVRRESLLDVGLMDEGYFLHCEDLDLCMSFRKKGWKIMFVPTASVVHHKGTCSKKRPIFVEWHKHKGMMRFYGKHFRHQYPGVLLWIVIIGVWLRFSSLTILYSTRHISNWFKHDRL